MSNQSITPLFAYPGGKRKLLKKYSPYIPQDFISYVEPFFGGGAVFCSLQNHHGPTVINDKNDEVAEIYTTVRDDYESFIEELRELDRKFSAIPQEKEARKAHFYNLRAEAAKNPTVAQKYMLRKTAFNVTFVRPILKATAGFESWSRKSIIDYSNLEAWHNSLQNVEIYNTDYKAIPFDSRGAFIYLDPPYRKSMGYRDFKFDDADQKELIEWAFGKAEEGAKILISNLWEDDGFFEGLVGQKAELIKFYSNFTPTGKSKRELTELLIKIN